MSASPNKNSDDKPTPPDKTTVILLLGTIGDTTWRMFVPILSLTFAGVYADKALGTKPWLTGIGILVGSAVAGILVKRLLQKVNNP